MLTSTTREMAAATSIPARMAMGSGAPAQLMAYTAPKVPTIMITPKAKFEKLKIL